MLFFKLSCFRSVEDKVIRVGQHVELARAVFLAIFFHNALNSVPLFGKLRQHPLTITMPKKVKLSLELNSICLGVLMLTLQLTTIIFVFRMEGFGHVILFWQHPDYIDKRMN